MAGLTAAGHLCQAGATGLLRTSCGMGVRALSTRLGVRALSTAAGAQAAKCRVGRSAQQTWNNYALNGSRGFAKAVGIDLGTTNSCVAVLEGGVPKILANSEGARTTPSVVAYLEDGSRLVGVAARRQAVTNGANTIYASKRLIGRRYDDPVVAKEKEHASYEIVRGENGDAWVKAGGEKRTPAQVGALILEKLKKTAEEYTGGPVREAVVTVPAYFNDGQRQATKDAGKIAGLEVKRIINEPTAAALAYGLSESAAQTVAVYDLGGGTFDVSVLEIQQGVFEVKATDGDSALGGEDWDQAVQGWLAERFLASTGVDLRQDRVALQRLREAAEAAKCELSERETTSVSLPFIAGGASGPLHLSETLDRPRLERLVKPLIERTREKCESALKAAGVKSSDLNEVLLVGGMTRMPAVRAFAEQVFGRKPSARVNPDEAVAAGAAIQAGVLQGEVKDLLLLDVTPLSLGIETLGGVFTKLIERNTTIPTKKTQVFSTAADGQTQVGIRVLQGERPLAAQNTELARFELQGLPPAAKGVPQIEVAFDVDANGVMHISAADQATGRSQRVTVQSSGGLSDAQVEAMIRDAREHEHADGVRAKALSKANQARALVDTIHDQLKQFPNMDSADKKTLEDAQTALTTAADSLDTAKEAKDIEALEKSVAENEALFDTQQKAVFEVTQKMYANAKQTPTEEADTDDTNKDKQAESKP